MVGMWMEPVIAAVIISLFNHIPPAIPLVKVCTIFFHLNLLSTLQIGALFGLSDFLSKLSKVFKTG
jgi:hypothetical protein